MAKPKSGSSASKTDIRRGVAQHEAKQHPGEPKTKLKLGKKSK